MHKSELGEAGLEPARPCGQGILSPESKNCKQSIETEVTSVTQGRLPASLPDAFQNDPNLAALITAWPELPASLKAGIVAMVNAATRS